MRISINFTPHEISEIIEATGEASENLPVFLRHLILDHLKIQKSHALIGVLPPHPLIIYFYKKMMPKYSITQQELAKSLNVSQQAVSKIFKGHSGKLSKEIIGFKDQTRLELEFVIPLFIAIYSKVFETFYESEELLAFRGLFDGLLSGYKQHQEIIKAIYGYCLVLGYKKAFPITEDEILDFFMTVKEDLPIELIECFNSSKEDAVRLEAFHGVFDRLGGMLEKLVGGTSFQGVA
jgi:transcriptional regulator with XRE-family HTH domain